MNKLYVKPLDLPTYVEDHIDELPQYELQLAESDEFTLYVTLDDNNMISFVICDESGDPVAMYEADKGDEADLIEKYSRSLDEIGYSPTAEYIESQSDDDDDDSDIDYQSTISEHEEEMNSLVSELIYEFMGADAWGEISSADIEEAAISIKEIVCQIMHKQYKLPVFRPMFLVSESGEKFYTEYPYPQMIPVDTPED